MADIKKFTLGSIYYEDSESITGDNYYDVTIDCRDDEAPQIYLTIPVALTIIDVVQIINIEVCIWVNEDAVNKLQEIVNELHSRIKEHPSDG